MTMHNVATTMAVKVTTVGYHGLKHIAQTCVACVKVIL